MPDDDSDDNGIFKAQTVPPPSGGDAYSAPTKVGPMNAALIEEMMHAAKQKADERKSAAITAARPAHVAPVAAATPREFTAPRPAFKPPISRVDPPEIQAPIVSPPAPLTPPDVAPFTALQVAAPLVGLTPPLNSPRLPHAPMSVAPPPPRASRALRVALAGAVVIVLLLAGVGLVVARSRGWLAH